jgi:hypothetical protein
MGIKNTSSTCAIGPHVITNAYYDLGASINVVSNEI